MLWSIKTKQNLTFLEAYVVSSLWEKMLHVDKILYVNIIKVYKPSYAKINWYFYRIVVKTRQIAAVMKYFQLMFRISFENHIKNKFSDI